MSIKLKSTIVILALFLINNLFSQKIESDTLFLYLDLQSTTIRYTINDNITFKIFRKGYETEKSRDSLKNLYSYRGRKTDIRGKKDLRKINPKDLPKTGKIPQVSIDFYSNNSPVKIENLLNLNYIDEKEFRLNEASFLNKKKKIILFKNDKNEYYKCEVFLVESE